jgi:hypothetical protein
MIIEKYINVRREGIMERKCFGRVIHLICFIGVI